MAGDKSNEFRTHVKKEIVINTSLPADSVSVTPKLKPSSVKLEESEGYCGGHVTDTLQGTIITQRLSRAFTLIFTSTVVKEAPRLPIDPFCVGKVSVVMKLGRLFFSA